jgi:hypothetical protein
MTVRDGFSTIPVHFLRPSSWYKHPLHSAAQDSREPPMLTHRLTSKLAFFAGLAAQGCGAITPLPEGYARPNPVVADVPTTDSAACGVPVACGRPMIGAPCSTPNAVCNTGSCGGPGDCVMTCISRGQGTCLQWQPAAIGGPLMPPELIG